MKRSDNGARRTPRRAVDPVVRAYGVTEVERLTGVDRITLHVWDRTGFIRASLARGGRGTGNRRKYSFADVVAGVAESSQMLHGQLAPTAATVVNVQV